MSGPQVLPKEYYYSLDGQKVEGPHTGREIAELLQEGTITENTHLISTGETEWKVVGHYPDIKLIQVSPLEIEEVVSVAKTLGAQHLTEEDTAEATEEAEERKTKRKSRHAMLRGIRAGLDRLWEAQREAIIAKIRDEDLDVEYEATRRQHKDIFNNIQENALEYWRADGVLSNWINDLTWNDADFTLKFKGQSEPEKFNEVVAWLTSKNINSLPGVYSFINGKEYIYVGQAKDLGARIKQHEQKTFFSQATRFRVIIPQNRRMLNKLERLVILSKQPIENRSNGPCKGNPADDCLEFIKREIKELISDF